MFPSYIYDFKDIDQTNTNYKQHVKFQYPEIFDQQYDNVLQSFIPETVTFTLRNIDVSVANGIRRSILSDVKSYNLSIKEDAFYENNTIYKNDSHMKTRFEMIPLYISDEQTLNTVKGLIFKVQDVKNKNDMYINNTSMIKHFRVQDLLTSKPELMKNTDILKLFSYLFNKRSGQMVSDVNILSLRPNDKMKFDIGTTYKNGDQHGCFQSAVATYTIYETKKEKMFDFLIESNGHYPPKIALQRGIEEIILKLNSFITTTIANIDTVFEENSFTDENIVEMSFDMSSMLLDIKVLRESHTLGGLIQEHLIKYLPDLIKMCKRKVISVQQIGEESEESEKQKSDELDEQQVLRFIYERMKIFYKKAHPLDEHIFIGIKIVLPTYQIQQEFDEINSHLKYFSDVLITLNEKKDLYKNLVGEQSKMMHTVSFYVEYLIYVCDRIYDTYNKIYNELIIIDDVQIPQPHILKHYDMRIPIYENLGVYNGHMYTQDSTYTTQPIVKTTTLKKEKTNLERAIGRLKELTKPHMFSIVGIKSIDLQKILNDIITKTTIKRISYLDIGCGDGAITSMIGAYINDFHKTNNIQQKRYDAPFASKEYVCNGTDIINSADVIFENVNIEQIKKFNEIDKKIALEKQLDKIGISYMQNIGSIYELEKLGLPPNSINLITAFESLHHIQENGYTTLHILDNYIMSGGYVIIREHDTHPEDTTFKTWLYNYHATMWDDETLKNDSLIYLPELVRFMKTLKYEQVAVMTYKASYNPQHIFYAIFRKL